MTQMALYLQVSLMHHFVVLPPPSILSQGNNASQSPWEVLDLY